MTAFDAMCLAIDAGSAADNAVVHILQFIRLIGPGCVFTAFMWLVIWACDKTVDRVLRRYDLPAPELDATEDELADQRRRMTALSQAIDNAPLTPTKPGHDKNALDTCNAIYKLPARKETP